MAKIDVNISLHLSAETNSYNCANDIQEQGKVGKEMTIVQGYSV